MSVCISFFFWAKTVSDKLMRFSELFWICGLQINKYGHDILDRIQPKKVQLILTTATQITARF